MNVVKTIKLHAEDILVFTCFSILVFFFLLNSPLHPWIGGTTATDSSVFKTIALVMENGGMPYRDSFDHKGPLLYILNWLGNRVSQYRGVWVIEFAFVLITVFSIYKTSRLICKINAAVITALLAMSLLFEYFEGGNCTEEYAMGFISVATYIYIDYFINDRISRSRLVLCGISLGGTLLLRPNMISIWFVMSLAVLLKCILGKEYKKIGFFLKWFCGGILFILVPIIVWLEINGALNQCWKDYILFNIVYSSEEGGKVLFSDKWNSYFTFAGTSVYLISFTALVALRKSYSKYLNYAYLVYMVVTPLFICLSGRTYGHYGMVLVPTVSYPIALMFKKIQSINDDNVSKSIYLVVSVYLLSIMILPGWISLVKTIPDCYYGRNEQHRNNTVTTVTNIINSIISENERISVFGNWNAIYVSSNHTHATRYSYQYPIAYVMPEIAEEYFEQLQDEQPTLIVVQESDYLNDFDGRMRNFLTGNEYSLIWAQDEETLSGALIFCKE